MPFALLLRPSVILGLLLALSVVANVTLFKMRDSVVKHLGSVTAERDQAIDGAKQCTVGVENMKKAATAREKNLKAALAKAKKAAVVAATKSETTLQIQPSQPDNLCASALDLSHQKLQERQKIREILEGIKQ